MDPSSAQPGHIGIVAALLPFLVIGTFAVIAGFVGYLIARALKPAEHQRPRH